MADVKVNVAKGYGGYYGSLPAANDSLIVVPLTGTVTDATIADYTDLAALLGGALDEQTTMGRKTLTGVTSTVSGSGTSGKRVVDADNPTWTAASGSATTRLALCYKPDTASADSAIIPIIVYDFVTAPAGGDITANINAGGLFDEGP